MRVTINPKLKQLEQQIIAWATAQPAIRAAIICGSTERQVNPGDEWADLDFEMYVTDFGPFMTNTDWLQAFGPRWLTVPLHESDSPVFLTLYGGGEKVDIHFFLVQELQQLVERQELHDAYQRGYRVAVDKDQLAAQLPPPSSTPPPLPQPSAEAFEAQVNLFWYGALYVAKQIRRRNLWVVKFRDNNLKTALLQMLEWHAQAQHEWHYDTWHNGHFMAQWVDAPTWQALQATFGEFGAESSWRALLATITLFHQLARETAEALHYAYPMELAKNVSDYITALYQADDLSHHSP